MAKCKLIFGFNSMITGVTPETGLFDETTHSILVKPVRGRIMSTTDGIEKMYIGRDGLQLTYWTEMNTFENILEGVKAGIAWAATQDSLFPLRGNKTPEVILMDIEPKSSMRKMLIARFNSDLYAQDRVIGTNGEFSQERFDILIGDLRGELVHFDGVRHQALTRREIGITFDSTCTNRELLEAHVAKILLNLFGSEHRALFPFAKSFEALELKFTEHNAR